MALEANPLRARASPRGLLHAPWCHTRVGAQSGKHAGHVLTPRSSGPGLGLVGRHIRGSQIISDWVRGTEPGGRPCETWPLALRGPMTGTHGVCVSDVSQRRSSSLRKERSRRVARTSFTGEGGTGCAVLGRAAEVARVRVAPREVTGIVQPGWPSVSPDTPA